MVHTNDNNPAGLRSLAIDALTAVSKAQHDSVAKMFAADLRQHDPLLANGLTGALSLCDKARREPYTRVVHRTLADGQHVLLHSSTQPLRRREDAGVVAFDLFRFEGQQIVEHWRSEEPNTGINPSGRTQVDGEVAIADLDLTRDNLELVRLFKQLVTVELRYDFIERFIDDRNYAQHASKVGDGIARLKKRIAEVAQQANRASTAVMNPRKYLAEGNFVFCLVEARSELQHNANWDLFRLENRMLVEHWDVISAIPPREAWKSDTGPF